MEALVLIFGDLVFALLAPILVVIAEMLGVMGAGVCSLPGKTPIGTGSARVLRYIAVALVVLVMITVSAAWVVDRYYFAPTVRYLFGTMEPRLGIVASCERIEGSLFAGKIGLDDCHLQREEHEALSFELSVERMALDVRLASVLSTAVIDVAEVKGIRRGVRFVFAGDRAPDSSILKHLLGGTGLPNLTFNAVQGLQMTAEVPRDDWVAGALVVSRRLVELLETHAEERFDPNRAREA